MPTEIWFDAHLDLAYLQLQGRPMHLALSNVQQQEPGASVTVRSLADAKVRTVLATIFVQPWDRRPEAVNGPWCYQGHEDAYQLAKRQLDIYDQWYAAGLLQRAPQSGNNSPTAYLLMEGCDPIREIDDIEFFYGRGVRVISLTWIGANRWAAGNNAEGGLTGDGKRLLQRADELGMILDVSHLSERAFFDAIDTYPGAIIASHSNCRELLPPPLQSPRNLTDEQIRRLFHRRATIGINLYSKFLASGRATLDDVARHIEHMADIGGSMNFIGLGSDMDGGFDATALPVNLESHADLPHLAEALSQAGIAGEDISRFAFHNWESAIGLR